MRTAALWPLLALLAAVGCSAPAAPPPAPSATPGAGVTLRPIDCPPRIEAQFLSRHECSEFLVPQDRDEPDGAQVRLLLLKVWPVGVDPLPGLGIALGSNAGDPPPLGGDIAAGATRGRGISLNLSYRGGALQSDPSLACPEVDQLSTADRGDRDDTLRAEFAEAIADCVRRLREAGVDPADYSAADRAADIEELRIILGEEQWKSSGSYGTESRTLATYLQAYPGRVAAAFADSPASIALDPLTQGVVGLDSVLEILFAREPDLAKSWSDALLRTRDDPLRGELNGSAVLIDDAKLVRLIRYALGGDGPVYVDAVPAMIAAAAQGELDPVLAGLAAKDPPFCAGYIPLCHTREAFSLGLFLTDFCERLPTDSTDLTTAIAGRPAYDLVFGNSPYEAACQTWGVRPVKQPGPSVDSPLLLLSGEYDSYSRPEWASEWAAANEQVWAVAIPGHTHNVLGSSECAITIRGAWRDNPTRPPDTTCAE